MKLRRCACGSAYLTKHASGQIVEKCGKIDWTDYVRKNVVAIGTLITTGELPVTAHDQTLRINLPELERLITVGRLPPVNSN